MFFLAFWFGHIVWNIWSYGFYLFGHLVSVHWPCLDNKLSKEQLFFWVLKNLLPQENADPTLSISEADSDQDDTVIDDDECRDVMDHDSGSCRDVSVNSDGFDISDEFQLDEPDLDCTKKSAHNNSDTEDEPRYI